MGRREMINGTLASYNVEEETFIVLTEDNREPEPVSQINVHIVDGDEVFVLDVQSDYTIQNVIKTLDERGVQVKAIVFNHGALSLDDGNTLAYLGITNNADIHIIKASRRRLTNQRL